MKTDLLGRLLAAKNSGTPVALVTDLTSGLQTLVFEDAIHGSFGLEDDQLAEVRERLRQDRSGLIGDLEDEDSPRLFVHAHNPPLRLLIVGAVHIAQPLAPIAALTGYAVTVIDPRGSFATAERFPGVALVDAWPDEALADLKIDSRTAIVTLTHDPKLDDPALMAALRSPAFYVGSLGSKRTHAKRVERLTQEGLTGDELARLHAPVGLDIGAVTPAEIAISVMAQITAVRRKANTDKSAAA